MSTRVRGRPLPPSDSLRLAAAWQELRPHWQSWLASAVVHATIVLVAAVFLGGERGTSAPEADRAVSIVLAPRRASGPVAEQGSTGAATADEAPQTSLSELIARDGLSMTPSDLLPAPSSVLGPGSAFGGVPSATGMERCSRGVGSFGADGARTEVFGITASGNRFAYVFDRSGSMGGQGRNPLQAAKGELLRSLARLSDLQQFQIIFYNDQPTVMRLAAQPGRLVLATEENKAQAREFLERITANGATRHEEALAAALRMRPDVIFFLTDADEPSMSKDQLARIRRLNDDRARIHAIEFGHGPKVGGADNFIVQLASQNGGQYRYLDVTRELEW